MHRGNTGRVGWFDDLEQACCVSDLSFRLIARTGPLHSVSPPAQNGTADERNFLPAARWQLFHRTVFLHARSHFRDIRVFVALKPLRCGSPVLPVTVGRGADLVAKRVPRSSSCARARSRMNPPIAAQALLCMRLGFFCYFMRVCLFCFLLVPYKKLVMRVLLLLWMHKTGCLCLRRTRCSVSLRAFPICVLVEKEGKCARH